MSTCESCGADILWAVAEAGTKLIPLDRDPVADGNVILVGARPTAHGAAPVARVLSPAAQPDLFSPGPNGEPAPDGPHYQAHWATCPDSDSWRQR